MKYLEKNNMKIYISLPMGGYEDSVLRRYNHAIKEVYSHVGTNEFEVVGPCNMNDFTTDGLSTPREHDWAWYMGKDVEILLRCDAIFMTQGYFNSPGCRVELAIAKERGMQIYYADDAEINL